MTQAQPSGARPKAPLASPQMNPRTIWIQPLLCALCVVVGLSVTLALPSFLGRQPLTVGTVSTQDVLAPRHVAYVSRLLTEAEQARADAAVEPVVVVDTDVARQQLSRTRQVLSYIESIRDDALATSEDKARWIAKIPDLTVATSVISTLLTLDETAWQGVSGEVIYLLDQMMRNGVRPDQLSEARAEVPQLVSYAFSRAR